MDFSLLLTQYGAQSPQVLWSARCRLVVVGTSYMIPIVYRYIDSYNAVFLLVYRGIICEVPPVVVGTSFIVVVSPGDHPLT